MDSGCDEFYPQTPSLLSECVEVYAESEQPQEQYYSQLDEWHAGEAYPHTYAPSNAAQQQERNLTQQHIIDNQALQTYDDLVKSPFVDELCLELDQWSNDPCFAQEMEAEKTAIVNAAEYDHPSTHEMTAFNGADLLEFLDF